MDQYRTSGVLDENVYREITRFSLSPRYVWFLRVYMIVLGILGIIMLIAREYHYAALLAFFTVLFAFTPRIVSRRRLRTAIKRMNEVDPKCIRTESFFTVDGIALQNLTSNAQGHVSYEVLCRAVETEHYFSLFTKANQCVLVFKDCLTPEQLQSFLPDLKQRCPQVKIKKTKW